jgi:hypothetical protein
MELCIRCFELLHFGDYSALDTCSYGTLHSLIRIVPFRCLLSKEYVLIWTFAFADSKCSISVTTQNWTRAHMDFCIRWFELLHFGAYTHWTSAHMDFCIWWFELLHFGNYSALDTCSNGLLHSTIRTAHFGDHSALDTCSYGLMHSLKRTAPFRWLLSTWHVLICTFAFADSNCSISVTSQHRTRDHMDLCIRWNELLHFGN